MQSLTVTFVLLCVTYSALASIGYIDDTKAQDCSSGTCVDVCQYDGLSMLPGTEINNDGLCRRVRCHRDFSVHITHCSTITSLDKCRKFKDNSKLSFPKCCEKTCKYSEKSKK